MHFILKILEIYLPGLSADIRNPGLFVFYNFTKKVKKSKLFPSFQNPSLFVCKLLINLYIFAKLIKTSNLSFQYV